MNAILGILFFFGITLINVMLATTKSILTIKSGAKAAALINAISYGFYTLVVRSMVSFETTIAVTVVIIANLIGVYVSKNLLDKFKKDNLWKITVIARNEDYDAITKSLQEKELGYNDYQLNTKYGTSFGIDIFSHNQKDSQKIKEILNNFEVKYHILEINHSL